MTTYLVTGSAGFIGSNLCHHLVSLGERVIGIDNLSVGSSILNMPGLLNTGFSFIYCNILDRSTLHTIFSEFEPDVVFQLAAETHVDRSIQDSSDFWKTNVLGTVNLLECSRICRVRVFINQITDELFPQEIESRRLSLETDRFAPTSPYACSKTAQYYVGKSFLNTYGLPIISTFPSNTFGPRQWPEKLIPKFILKLSRQEKVPLMKSINNERDWLAVDDHCKALIHLSKYGILGEDYNIGAENFYSNIIITNKLLSLTGKDETAIQLVPDRKTHDKKYSVNSEKIRKLGWQPIEDFNSYLKKTVEWYIERKDMYPKEL